MDSRRYPEHGNRCSCRLLANVIGCKPGMIRFAYCQSVLMKHWVMQCNHGSHEQRVEPVRSGKWQDVGPMDRVAAILIRNG